MKVFGLKLDNIYKNRKLYGKLPNYCQNLFPEESKYKCVLLNNSYLKSIKNKKSINSQKKTNSLSTKNILKNNTEIKARNTINEKDIFIDFNKNNFIDNANNTGKDYLYFKIKLRKINPLKKENNVKYIINLKRKNKSSFSFSNINLTQNKNNISKIYSKKEKHKILNNLHFNISPLKKKAKIYDEKKYEKKWNSPKAFTFDKVSGRKKIGINNRIKNSRIEITKNYNPNYNYIYSDTSKSFVKYDKNNVKNFQKTKSGIIRKTICNYKNVFHSSENYNIINAIIEEKKKIKEEKIKKMKKKFGNFYDYWENRKYISYFIA